MTRFIKDRDVTAANAGLQPAQQHMLVEISASINAMIEMDRLTPQQAFATLERLTEIVKRRVKG